LATVVLGVVRMSGTLVLGALVVAVLLFVVAGLALLLIRRATTHDAHPQSHVTRPRSELPRPNAEE
jgi:hypothetical protein